jgi:hypothetical protein
MFPSAAPSTGKLIVAVEGTTHVGSMFTAVFMHDCFSAFIAL